MKAILLAKLQLLLVVEGSTQSCRKIILTPEHFWYAGCWANIKLKFNAINRRQISLYFAKRVLIYVYHLHIQCPKASIMYVNVKISRLIILSHPLSNKAPWRTSVLQNRCHMYAFTLMLTRWPYRVFRGHDASYDFTVNASRMAHGTSGLRN